MSTTYFVSYGQPCPDGFVNVDLNETSLDDAIDDGEAKEIVAVDIVHCFPRGEHRGVIAKLCRKLRKGGALHMSLFDIDLLVRKAIGRRISVDEFDRIIFGLGKFKSTANYTTILQDIAAVGMKIGRIHHHTDHRFHVNAKKG